MGFIRYFLHSSKKEAFMEIYTSILNTASESLASIRSLLPTENACFFDIETTGLSPGVSNVYLIGAAEVSDGKARLTQWFANDYTSEKDLLLAFSEYLSRFDTVIHYNGSTFDIPYLTKKYVYHGLADPFLKLDSLDLYREINTFCRKHRKDKNAGNIFGTENLKLISVEKLCGFDRGRDFSGKECIDIYTTYMQEKFSHNDANMTSLRNSLLSHNHDDLEGTVISCLMLTYTRYIPVKPSLEIIDDCAYFADALPSGQRFPFTLTVENIRYEESAVCIKVPLFKGTLYHYFPDYKNYFYLPDEDMAVHKSVGGYVDKEHREKATASNCYIKKTGTFMPIPHITKDDVTVFKEKNAPKGACYIESHSASADDMISFLL